MEEKEARKVVGNKPLKYAFRSFNEGSKGMLIPL
jgi:hypothetical protein